LKELSGLALAVGAGLGVKLAALFICVNSIATLFANYLHGRLKD
jgi:hypothetical protein